jgi:S-adenosylmethionine uptake transporter
MSSPRPFVVAAAGIAALCALDATVKELTRSYAVAYAVLGRYVFGSVFALAVWWWQGGGRG